MFDIVLVLVSHPTVDGWAQTYVLYAWMRDGPFATGSLKALALERPERRRSGQLALQRMPLAVDPNADRHDRRDDRHDQNPEQDRVLDQCSAFLVFAEPAD